MRYLYCTLIYLGLSLIVHLKAFAQNDPLIVKKCEDFEVNGKGDNEQWNKTEWEEILQRKEGGKKYSTKVKVLYSETGMYFLFELEDELITSTLKEDFADLWTEDVVEVFLWTDENYPFYFEYELSPSNYELPILVPNVEGNFLGWKPWNYEGDRLTRHATSMKNRGKKLKGWNAEFYIPYTLLKPMANVPPAPGTQWRANMYRLDYDSGVSSWAWRPITNNFHDYKNFGIFLFE